MTHSKSSSWRLHRQSTWVVAFVLSGSLLGAYVCAAEPDGGISGRVAAHLAAGEFGPALQIANRARDASQRDRWLQDIAQGQFLAGARSASFRTAYNIQNDRVRAGTYQQLASTSLVSSGSSGSRGGAALADFDSLMDLITTTTSPDSWDAVGGPGAIEPFATGVYVDSSGALKRIVREGESGRLSAVRKRASLHATSGDPARPSALRKISLTRLERYAQMLHAEGRSPDPVMRALAGLYEIKYVLLYPETRDIVLAGPAGDWTTDAEGRPVNASHGRPVVRLDDFVVLLRNAYANAGVFGCSIKPRKESLADVQTYLDDSAGKSLKPTQRDAWIKGLRDQLGKQDIHVFGIDPRTQVARTIVEADYHMKLVGMGLEDGAVGVTSYLDNVAARREVPSSMAVLRWWFVLNYSSIRSNESRDAYELSGPGVRVLSENEMLTARGERIHTGKSDERNLEFAHSFTKHFPALATKYPVYADLKNVFDLALVAGLIRSENLAGRLDWQRLHFGDSGSYLVPFGPAAKQVESVVNHRIVERKNIIVGVSGGVSVDTRDLVQSTAIERDQYGLLHAAHASSSPARVPKETWWWD